MGLNPLKAMKARAQAALALAGERAFILKAVVTDARTRTYWATWGRVRRPSRAYESLASSAERRRVMRPFFLAGYKREWTWPGTGIDAGNPDVLKLWLAITHGGRRG